jgi:hypothetical protein
MSGHSSGFKGGLMASEGLALTAIDLLSAPSAIAEAKTELAARVGAGETLELVELQEVS